MNIWLHRIKHEFQVSLPLLNTNDKQNKGKDYTYLSIGWSRLGKQNADITNEIKNINKPRRTYLLNFIKKMKKGDWILVPTKKKFSIYELLEDEPIKVIDFTIPDGFKDSSGKLVKKNADGGLCYENDIPIDLGFFRKVKKVETFLSRKDYANAILTRKMKFHGTSLNITKCENDINEAIKNFKHNTPINPSAQILAKTIAPVLNIIREYLEPKKLEKLVGWYFLKLGANSVAAGEKNADGDVDVVASFEALNLDIYVQVKHHKNKTGDKAVNQIIDYYKYINENNQDEENTVSCWVISTGDDFLEDAKNLANEHNVRLITGKDFATMLLKVGIDDLESFENVL